MAAIAADSDTSRPVLSPVPIDHFGRTPVFNQVRIRTPPTICNMTTIPRAYEDVDDMEFEPEIMEAGRGPFFIDPIHHTIRHSPWPNLRGACDVKGYIKNNDLFLTATLNVEKLRAGLSRKENYCDIKDIFFPYMPRGNVERRASSTSPDMSTFVKDMEARSPIPVQYVEDAHYQAPSYKLADNLYFDSRTRAFTSETPRLPPLSTALISGIMLTDPRDSNLLTLRIAEETALRRKTLILCPDHLVDYRWRTPLLQRNPNLKITTDYTEANWDVLIVAQSRLRAPSSTARMYEEDFVPGWHNLHYNRVIVDQCHEFKPQDVRLTRLKRDFMWCLSPIQLPMHPCVFIRWLARDRLFSPNVDFLHAVLPVIWHRQDVTFTSDRVVLDHPVWQTMPSRTLSVARYSAELNIPQADSVKQGRPNGFVDCPICLESDVDGVCRTSCNHMFCKACLLRCKKHACPMCRQRYSVSETYVLNANADASAGKWPYLLRMLKDGGNQKILIICCSQAVFTYAKRLLRREKRPFVDMHRKWTPNMLRASLDQWKGRVSVAVARDSSNFDGLDLSFCSKVVVMDPLYNYFRGRVAAATQCSQFTELEYRGSLEHTDYRE